MKDDGQAVRMPYNFRVRGESDEITAKVPLALGDRSVTVNANVETYVADGPGARPAATRGTSGPDAGQHGWE